jgi:hypothetical protein
MAQDRIRFRPKDDKTKFFLHLEYPPLNMPYFCKASKVYLEQVGWYLHFPPPIIGEIEYL